MILACLILISQPVVVDVDCKVCNEPTNGTVFYI
jgi:hypothetical protein